MPRDKTAVAVDRVVLLLPKAEDLATVREAFAEWDTVLEVMKTLSAARRRLERGAVEVLVAEHDLPGGSALELLKERGSPAFPLVLLTAEPDEREAVEAIKAGATDYLAKTPKTLAALPLIVRGAVREWRQLRRLEAAQAQLRHANRLIGTGHLAAITAHEVGTPLNVARLQAQLLSMADHGEEVTRAADEIVAQIDEVSERLQSLLDYARVGRKGRTPVSLSAVAERAMDLLEPLAERHGVRLILEPTDDPGLVLGDARQLRQVLFNLLNNAVDALRGRGGEIHVSIHGDEGDVSLSVTDDGPGVPPEDRGRLFEPFFTSKPAGRGTGLGLSVCRDIVLDHHGQLGFRSEEPSGTTFVMTLPRLPDRTS